jgi:hypothetical protein
MMKKLAIILLTIIFSLSAFSLLPVKKIFAHTESKKCMLMAAEPWHWWYHSGKGGSGANSGSSGGDNQVISDPTNHSKHKHSPNSPAQPSSCQREHKNIIKHRNQPLGWWWKFLLFAKMIFNR